MADLSRFGRAATATATDPTQKADPSSKGKGAAGVLPYIENPAGALQPLDDTLWGKMEHDYQHGRLKGQTTHVPALDYRFKWMPGYTNVITGWPGHGKSQLFFELLLLRAIFDGKKSAIYPAENLPAELFYDELIHTLTGKNPDRSLSVGQRLPLNEYRRAKDFIRDHIYAVAPPRGYPRTPSHMLGYFEAAIAKYGVEHCMIDPWNKCDHTAQGKMGGIEAYLIHTLGLCTDWSMDTGQCLVITAHPRRLEGMEYGKSRQVPDGSSISGGQTWENMAHIVGAVHRPNKHDEADNSLEIYIHKVKSTKLVGYPGHIGRPGPEGMMPDTRITFDRATNRYLWNDWSPLDRPIVRQLYECPAEPLPNLFPASTVRGLEFDAIPPDMLPGGARPIRLPHN
jgi:hypothetical protein